MGKKGSQKNGDPGKEQQEDRSIPIDGELESVDVFSKDQVSGNKAILALHLTNKSSLHLQATESVLQLLLQRLLILYHREALDFLQEEGHLSTLHRY